MATFADGLAVRVAIPEAVELVNGVVDRMLLVSERAMAEAIGAFHRAGIRAEGAAAAGLAALPQLPMSSTRDGSSSSSPAATSTRPSTAAPSRTRAPFPTEPAFGPCLLLTPDFQIHRRQNRGGLRAFVACSKA